MNNKILIVNVCKNKMHYLEFVKPVEEIIKQEGKEYETKNYKKIDYKELKDYNKIIICGTSLQDNEYLENADKFEWIKKYKGKILGICAGAQIICKLFGCKLIKKVDIGMKQVLIKTNFFGLQGWVEVYELHNYSIEHNPIIERKFDIFSQGSIDAIKHKEKNIYAVMFHPEARQKSLIANFVNIE